MKILKNYNIYNSHGESDESTQGSVLARDVLNDQQVKAELSF